MFRLALSSLIYFLLFETPIMTLWSSCAPKHVLWQRVFRSASEFKVRNLIQWTGHFAIQYVRWLFGWRYISSLHSADETDRQTDRLDDIQYNARARWLTHQTPTSSNKSETAVHCCDPALSVLVMLVSRNVFHVVSALQPFAFILSQNMLPQNIPSKYQNLKSIKYFSSRVIGLNLSRDQTGKYPRLVHTKTVDGVKRAR